MKTKKIILAILLVFAFSATSFAQDGKHIFRANCASCHSVGKGKLTGPDLKDVHSRYEEAWMMKWIKSSQTVIKSGDTLAVRLYNENNKIIMPDQPLNEDEIKSVLAFIKTEGESVTASAKNPVVISSKLVAQANDTLLSMFDFSGYILMMLMGLTLIIIWVMSMSIKTLSLELKEKNKS